MFAVILFLFLAISMEEMVVMRRPIPLKETRPL